MLVVHASVGGLPWTSARRFRVPQGSARARRLQPGLPEAERPVRGVHAPVRGGPER